jgi:hypothetical protein
VRTTLYQGQPPGALGLILFGGTSDGSRAYFPLQRPGGGIVAVRLSDGAIELTAKVDADNRGQSGAATSIPGVVFSGGWDGMLCAVDAAGKVAGPAIVDGRVYTGAGYIGVQNGTPGNVPVAFAPHSRRRTLMTRLMQRLVVSAAVLAVVPLAAAADVAGSWKLDGAIGQFPVDLVCTLKQADAKLSGICKGDPIGELPVSGEVGPKEIRFSYQVNFQGQPLTVTYVATVEAATAMKGTVEVMGMPSGQFTGRKQ